MKKKESCMFCNLKRVGNQLMEMGTYLQGLGANPEAVKHEEHRAIVQKIGADFSELSEIIHSGADVLSSIYVMETGGTPCRQ